MPDLSRPTRRFVLGLAAAGIAKIAQGATPADHALVCVYLLGGNDGNNLIVPLERAQYQAYERVRGPLALAAGDLLPVQASRNSGTYGFHPALSELRDLYNQGALAVVANVGSLEYHDSRKGHPYDSVAFLEGGTFTLPFAAARAGLKVTDKGGALVMARGVTMVSQDVGGSRAPYQEMVRAAGAVRFRSPFPSTGISNSLKEVVGLIQAARGGGLRNPVFTIAMGGFDTRAAQLQMQASLFRELSAGMAAFYAAADEVGIADKVTVFTESEFGRTIKPVGNNGSGDGWGNHHLVMGGSVLGHDIYGVFPDIATAERHADGGWVPTTSREQYLSTLANWAGVPYSDLQGLFPRLSGNANLGFMA
ncbi:MAG TPA: DUF1501 domain-containing protein [Bryobacteraceae bacterium]|nr:DUF1501 domain-containing protein [Bryobacteraceae bacterium]